MTETQRYNVLLVGTDDAGGPDEAAAKLVARFRLSERVAAKLVRRLPAKVKKSVDRRQAEKYAKALRGLGMVVEVAAVGTTGDYEAMSPSADGPTPQPLVHRILDEMPSSLGSTPDAGFSSEVDAFLRGEHPDGARRGPSFELPGHLAPLAATNASPPPDDAGDARDRGTHGEQPAQPGGAVVADTFAMQFSGALDPSLHTAVEVDLGEENAAIEDLFGIRATPLDELASIDDAPAPVVGGGTAMMAPLDEFGPSGGEWPTRRAGPGAASTRRTAVERPAADWIERGNSYGPDVADPIVDVMVTASREAALEETLAELSGDHPAAPSLPSTDFDAVSARMETTLTLDESVLQKTGRTSSLGPTTSALRTYRQTDSYRPPPPRSKLPTVLGVLTFLAVAGVAASFGYQYWESLQPPAVFGAATERFALREQIGAVGSRTTCADIGEGRYLCRYDRAFFRERFPDAVAPALEQAADDCYSTLTRTADGVAEEMTCRFRLERGESRQAHRFDFLRYLSCDIPLTTLADGESTRCALDVEITHFVDGVVQSDDRAKVEAQYSRLRELELLTDVGQLTLVEYDVTPEGGGLERAFFSDAYGLIVRRRDMSGRATLDILSLDEPPIPAIVEDGSAQ